MAWIITGLKKLKEVFDNFCGFITQAATEQPQVVGSIILALVLYFLVCHMISLIH